MINAPRPSTSGIRVAVDGGRRRYAAHLHLVRAVALENVLRHAPRNVIVDLGAAECIDVAAVRTLPAAHRQAILHSVPLLITPAPHHVHKVSVVCGVERELPFLAAVPGSRHARRITGAPAARDRTRARAANGNALPANSGIDRHVELRRRARSAWSPARETDAGSRHV